MSFIKLYSAHGKRLRTKQTGKGNFVFSILLCVFAVTFVVSSVMVIRYYLQSEQEEEAFAELATVVLEQPKPVNLEKSSETAEEHSNNEVEMPQYTEYLALYEQNQDFAGWLRIENAQIDYPVMLTQDDPEYYLRRAFDQSSSQSGTPFIGAGATADSDMFIIYGHNMKNDTMFGALDEYSAKTFWEENHFFDFATITEYRKYEVFAAVKTHVLLQNESGYRYYDQAGNLSESEFETLVQWLIENSLYDTEVIPEYGEQIVILSTCSYHQTNGRFLVAARRIDYAETDLSE